MTLPTPCEAPAARTGITLTRWNRHGDHPAVLPYGESTLEHFPAYAACGVVERNFSYQHVAPGFWLVTVTLEGRSETLVAKPGELERLLDALGCTALELA